MRLPRLIGPRACPRGPHATRAAPAAPRDAQPIPASVTEHVRTVPWFMKSGVGGENVATVLERQLRFAIRGDGPLSTREIVPETQGARDALAGALGERLKTGLRSVLGTFDAQTGVTELKGIALSDTAAGFALNAALGEMELPGYGAELPQRAWSRAQRDALGGRLKEVHEMFRHATDAGYSPPYLTVSPDTTATFFYALDKGRKAHANEPGEADAIDAAAHVLVHELAHRLSPPPLKDPPPTATAKQQQRYERDMSLLQLLSEGSADIATGVPGTKREVARQWGYPDHVEQLFPDGYEPFVGALTTLLRQAGVEPTNAAGGRAARRLTTLRVELPQRGTAGSRNAPA